MTKETYEILMSLDIHPEIKITDYDKRRTLTEIKVSYLENEVLFLEDCSLKEVIHTLFLKISHNSYNKGVEKGKEILKYQFKNLLGI